MGYLVIVLLINVCSVFAKPVTKQGTNLITAIVGSRAKLPCNFPKLEPHDRVRLILWYREDIGTPIYSVDARDANFSMAGHWSEEKLFGRRASFQADNVSAALVVNGVRKEDEGFFRCRTDFLHAQTRNLFTQLQVVVPPRKVWLTRSDGAILSSVLEGLREEERLDLTCHAEGGDPSPRLLWLEDNKPIDAVEEITSGDLRKLRLRINALQRHHSGVLLTCEASNSNLIQPVTASVKLGLYLRPIEVKIDDTTKHLSAGVEANLVCRAYGARPPPLFTWWMDNVLKEELGVETSSQNETVSSIRFTPQITDRGKLIKCSVRQRNETILDPEDRMSIEYQLETTRLLFIYYKPIVTLRLGASLTSRQIKEGDDIYFDCIIDAVPLSYKILWFHNEQELHHNVSFGRIISNYSLALQKIERKMSGKYVCLAANSEGQTVSNAVVLDVLYSPVCKIKFTKVYGVGRHEEISILCEVESSPKDIKGFRWALNSTSNGKITEIPSVNYTIDGSTSTLKYVPSSDVEFGTALCWAKNIVGEQKIPCVFQIVAAERPDPVRNCTLSNQSTDSLSFQCLEGFSGGLEQHFLLKVLASNGTVLRDNISSSTAAFSIRGLNPDSMFLLSVQAVNPKGRSDAVVSKVFTLRPPETQKNTEANSKSSKSGDFLTENSPLIGAITGAVLCLLLLTAPIVLAFLRSIRSRRLERERYPLETISGATFVHCQVRDKPDVVPQKGNLRGKINVKSFHHFHTPTESDILCKESTGSYGIIKSSMRKNIASTIMEGQLGDKSSCSKTKSYLDILTEANYDYQKHESEV